MYRQLNRDTLFMLLGGIIAVGLYAPSGYLSLVEAVSWALWMGAVVGVVYLVRRILLWTSERKRHAD